MVAAEVLPISGCMASVVMPRKVPGNITKKTGGGRRGRGNNTPPEKQDHGAEYCYGIGGEHPGSATKMSQELRLEQQMQQQEQESMGVSYEEELRRQFENWMGTGPVVEQEQSGSPIGTDTGPACLSKDEDPDPDTAPRDPDFVRILHEMAPLLQDPDSG